MNEPPLLSLINNVALLLAMGVIYDAFSLSVGHQTLSKKILTGVCVGAIGVALMSMPLVSMTGVIIDARSILLSVSGLFFGAVPTFIAVIMTVTFRVFEGGAGTTAGVMIILLSALVGLLYRGNRKEGVKVTWLNLYFFGLVVHVGVILCFLMLPKDVIGKVARDAFLPILIIFPLATVLFGVLLIHQRERRQAEVALRSSQKESERIRLNLEATLAAVPDLLFEMDLEGRYYQCHASNPDDLAKPADQLVGKTVFDVLPQDAANEVINALAAANFSGFSQGHHLVLPFPDGDQQFELSVARKSTEGVEGLRFIVLSRNITARKKAEQELHIAATAFDSQEGMMITDRHYNILRVNNAFTRVTGYEADEVIGRTPSFLKSGKHDEGFYRVMMDALAANYYWQGEVWNKRKNGEIYPQSLTITAVRSEKGEVTNFVGSFTDITQRKKSEAYIHKLAYFDPLTGLPNRRSLQERLDSALNSIKRTRQLGALLFIDLDNFKTLNDTQGHNAGDQLLVAVAKRLERCVRNADMVARLGGDEFIVILENLGTEEASAYSVAVQIVEKINEALSRPVQVRKGHYHTACSIGITLFSAGDLADEVTKRADMAMYQAKSAGKNTYQLFDPDKHMALYSQAALEIELRKAMPEKQFELFYQVQFQEDQIIGAEALIRWRHPEQGMISPAEFIPLAEETGLIIPIGGWVLDQACEQLKKWQASEETSDLILAVNVSARQFAQEGFVEEVFHCVEEHGIQASRLKLELTESLVLMDIEDTIAKMRRLKLLGVRFALDDFGTGYSSLLHLKRLPLNQLKIDRSFINDILTDEDDAQIVQTIISMGLNLGLDVIAEGVETEAQRDMLSNYGCSLHQGFLLGKPMPIAEFTNEYLRDEADEAVLSS